ncbi:protein kinase domain-containing protein [Colletotrichum chrysophilum]|uniref:Protein kinase domain-containing protein n=1 Tax=Colletotrichum chrysophilum TaxID=1836956 RepID=A0AAD9ABB7_9PEZI|nr:protein kinase domain-containing protein [Colletotrichum chrysophilum]
MNRIPKRHGGLLRMPTAAPPLKAQLEAAMCTTLPLGAADPARSFLPNDELHRLVTPASALRTLRECAPGFTEEIRSIFAETIFTKSPQVVKSFAILVLIGRADAIFKFMDLSISDGDLPLGPTAESSTVVGSLSAPKCFDLKLAGLNHDDVVAFEEMQWRVCVPVIEELGVEGEPSRFHQKTILPFIWDGPVAPVIQQGGHSRVYQVRIHPAHHRFGASENHTPFAVKQLKSPSHRAFSHEVSNLRNFGDAPNIIKLLTAFKHGPTPYLVLPWAGPDLQSLWTQTDGPADEEHAILTAKQMLGVAEALKAIHYFRVKNRSRGKPTTNDAAAGNGYHADLKPENILVMDDRWTITDFGLSSAAPTDRPLGCSPTYRAPEHDVGKFDGQKADIWSLGCVMSVAATWMALGRKGVRNFRAKRALRSDAASRENGKVDDAFFEARDRKKGNGLRVKPAVTHWIDKLHQSPTATPFIHDLLDLVKNDMLEVDGEKRIASDQLVDRLREMHRKCSEEPGYAKTNPMAPKRIVVPKITDHVEAPRSISVNMVQLPSPSTYKYSTHNTWPLETHQLASQSFDPEPDGRSSTWTYAAAPEQPFGSSSLGLGSNVALADPVSHTIPMASPKSPRRKRRRDAELRSPAQSKRQKSASPTSPNDRTSGELFACPYFKHDQEKYGTKEWNSCGGPGWEIHRLKEHLKRVHRVEGHRCNCCLHRFPSLKGLAEHQRSEVRCVKQEDTGDDSIDETQWGKIQERNRGMKGAAKWEEIYKTIFPLDAVPSPYRDEPTSDLTLAAFRNFLENNMRQQISHAGQVRCQNGLDLLTEFELARSLSNSTTTSEVPSLVVDDSRCDTGMTMSSFESPAFTETSPSIIGFGAEDVGFGMSPCAPEMQQHLSFGHDFPLFPASPHVDMGASWQAPFFTSIPGPTFDESRLYPDLSLGP